MIKNPRFTISATIFCVIAVDVWALGDLKRLYELAPIASLCICNWDIEYNYVTNFYVIYIYVSFSFTITNHIIDSVFYLLLHLIYTYSKASISYLATALDPFNEVYSLSYHNFIFINILMMLNEITCETKKKHCFKNYGIQNKILLFSDNLIIRLLC